MITEERLTRWRDENFGTLTWEYTMLTNVLAIIEEQAREIAILRDGRCVSCMEPVNPLHPQCACTRAEIDELKDELREIALKDEALRDAIGMLQWATGAWRPEGTPETELAPARLRLHEAIERYRAALEECPEAHKLRFLPS